MKEVLLLLGWLAIAVRAARLFYSSLVDSEYDPLTTGLLAAAPFGLIALLLCIALFALVQFTNFGY